MVYEKYKSGEWDQFSIGFSETQVSTKAIYCLRFGENCKRVIAKCSMVEVSTVPGKLAVNQNTETLAVKASPIPPEVPVTGGPAIAPIDVPAVSEAPAKNIETNQTKCLSCQKAIEDGEKIVKQGDGYVCEKCHFKAEEVLKENEKPEVTVKAVIAYTPKRVIKYEKKSARVFG
jgi:DNA-directed RNA polymerase subunit RPC12/RpoP